LGCLLLALLWPGPLSAQRAIRLRNETIPTSAGAQSSVTPIADKAGPVSGLFLVQLEGAPQSAQRDRLAALGVDVLRYVPDDAFVVRLERADVRLIRSDGFVRWLGPYRPEYKLDARLRTNATPFVRVLLSPRVSAPERAGLAARFSPGSAATPSRFGDILEGPVSPTQLTSLARSDAVLWIEPAPRLKLYDEVSSRLVAGDGPPHQSLMQSLGYDGTGVTVAVADSGLDSGDANAMHPDIQGRVRAVFHYGTPGQLADGADEHSHGTHVAGIIAGNGAVGETDENGFLYGLGVAPGAGLIGQRIFDGAGGYAPPPSFETLTRDARRAGADIGSNSWGDDTQGHYDLSAMEFDALVRDADLLTLGDQPYILEFSAGNAGPGYQTVGSPAVAKNVIATGASQNDRRNLPIEEFAIYADGPDAMADFSSRGPCADGRIKPDLVAPGSWIASLRSIYANDDYAWWPISNEYLYQGGTSQAGPQVSGAAAVFVQYWRATHGGATPSPALVKAALINSATDLDDGLTTDVVPNADEGWGRVNLPALIGSPRDYDFTDQTTRLTNGGVFEKRLLVGSSAEPLKITLSYTDVPGLPAAAVALVNDLDLEVISPTGESFRGNRFVDGESTPDAPLPDAINNVEAVHLSAPVPGEYLIRVRGGRVVEDACVDSAPIDQDFALVVSGAFGTPGEGLVTFDRNVYRAPDELRLTLVDYDLASQSTATLQFRSGTEPLGEALTLRASGSRGVFTGMVATATGLASADGIVQIAHGDVIDVIYADASPPANRVFSALADLQPPVISGLQATNAFGQLTVSWYTDEDAGGELRYGFPTPSSALTHRALDTYQEFAIPNLAPDAVVNYFVVAQDEAGNRATNDNAGRWFTATNAQPPAILLVDSYTDYGGLIVAPPLSGYTDALSALGSSYDVFDARTGDLPTLVQLQSYRCLIWRMDELIAPDPTLVGTVARYVTNGGSLFIASMEAITRLGEAGEAGFVTNILQVHTHTADQPVNDIAGYPGDPVGLGLDTALDYETSYAELLVLLSFGGITDPSDWITPTTGAAPVLLAGGQIVGVRAPKTGVDLPGRVVYLSFPLDAVPLGPAVGNDRAGLLRNVLSFLTPTPGVSTVTLDSDVYSVPDRAVMEVEDADLGGQGSVAVTVRSPQHAAELTVTLLETSRAGLFRGQVVLAPTNSSTPGVYLVNPGDQVQVDYQDASAGQTHSVTAAIETNAPVITDVFIDPGYLEAVVTWTTSEAADSLAQYGESPVNLPDNFTAFDPLYTLDHGLFLSGLKPNTTYYLRVTSRDRAGNTATDDQAGRFYTFTTLQPLTPPWIDDLETNSLDWSVITAEESESEWTRGTPGGGEAAHSGTNCWGSNLGGGTVGSMESYLISPGILLTGGNRATLSFWHNYDFLAQGEFDFQLAAVEIITNLSTAPVVLYQMPEDASGGWEEFQFDLTPYLGQVVYLVWYHFLFSMEAPAQPGWRVDDVSVTVETLVPGTIQVTNNLSQTVFALTGPSGRTGRGLWLEITNAAPGGYTIEYGDVPFYATPAPQTANLLAGDTIRFVGHYTFADANTNGMSDSWETNYFHEVSPSRTSATDTDNDGAADYAEFMAGTDPTNDLNHLRLDPPQVQPNGDLLFTWASSRGRSYRLQWSPDLRDWTPGSEWIRATTTATSLQIQPPRPGPHAFFRLEVLP
jgi:hypothetical protein